MVFATAVAPLLALGSLLGSPPLMGPPPPPGHPAAGGNPARVVGRGYGAYGETDVTKAKAESIVVS